MKDTVIEADASFDTTAAWVASLPSKVQALAGEFPLGTEYAPRGVSAWLIGYTEWDELVLSRVNPYLHWQQAVAERFFCPAQLLRDLIAKECTHGRTH